MPSIEVIALVFKSVEYVDFIADELKSSDMNVPGWDVSVRIIANDATEAVKNHLPKTGVPYSIYSNADPNEYYINRVYRCYNYGAQSTKCDHVCFINSDMKGSSKWLENLLKYHDGVNIPTSRLVESGKMSSGMYGLSYNCGRTPSTFDPVVWKDAYTKLYSDQVHEGGLFMPCVFDTHRFIESGMYPEGNVYQDGVGTCGVFLESGDAHLFKRLREMFGMKHVTVFSSLVDHIQEGEKDA
jgi:hypothetical protein